LSFGVACKRCVSGFLTYISLICSRYREWTNHLRRADMDDEIEQHLAAVEVTYRPLITAGNSRLEGGAKLWAQFADAVASYRTDSTTFAAVYERINELAIAHVILADSSLVGRRILHEPQVAPDGRVIDFVVLGGVESGSLYIEVKTVRPTAEDSTQNWLKYEKRREFHTPDVKYIVNPNWRGAAIYTDSFSARSKFMEYVRDFEPRLANTSIVQPGRGLLVFCGTGMEWHRSELEDVADFYRTGKHRQDDPFAAMETESLRQGEPLLRNIAAIGFMKRPMDSTVAEECIADVRGPTRFGP
jgi:hypothetical protein